MVSVTLLRSDLSTYRERVSHISCTRIKTTITKLVAMLEDDGIFVREDD
jgi:hypothetical protein